MFIPSPDSGALQLDAAMRGDLAASLERLQQRAAAILPEAAGSMVRELRGHRVLPGVFARYYDLITALQRADWASAKGLWAEMSGLAAVPADFAVLPFGAEALGADGERYQRFFATGLARPPCFQSPGGAALAALRQAVPEAFGLLGEAAPHWADEIRALTTQVVGFALAAPDEGAVSGGSSMMAWGAVLVNVSAPPVRLRVLSVLAHEATHQLLFGLARSEPLVHNPVGERFATQVRPVPRPMNAVFHSTYVSGRIVALMAMLQRRAQLTADERSEAEAIGLLQLPRFRQGCELILTRAQLSPLGRRLIEEARDTVAALASAA